MLFLGKPKHNPMNDDSLILDNEESNSGKQKNINDILNNGYEFKMGTYIERGWEIVKKNLGLMIGFTILYLIITSISSLSGNSGSALSVVVSLGVYFITPALTAGFYIFIQRTEKNEHPTFGLFFKGFDFFLPLFLVSFIGGILTVIGLILLVIPGIYLAVAFSMGSLFVVFYKLDFWQSLESSRKIVSKRWWSFLLFFIVLFAINVAGLLALGVGILITIPLTFAAIYAAYDDIVGID